jgi:two-component system response regulator AdeR
MSETDSAVVLVVDDEPDVANSYAAHVEDRYEVRTAYSGREALEELDGTIDVVLLDRRMPDVSGDDVLDTIRDREMDCRVAMVTAVDPDFDIIDMPFDDYLVKPVSRQELLDVISGLLRCDKYESRLKDYYMLTSKMVALKSSKSQVELEDSEGYAELEDRRNRVRDELTEIVEALEDDDFYHLFRELDVQLLGDEE